MIAYYIGPMKQHVAPVTPDAFPLMVSEWSRLMWNVPHETNWWAHLQMFKYNHERFYP